MKRIQVWCYGTKQFDGTPDQFRATMVEHYENELIRIKKNLEIAMMGTIEEVLERAQRSDSWSIEVID